jgi:hypothetical protein
MIRAMVEIPPPADDKDLRASAGCEKVLLYLSGWQ